jgi:hypothetical protein
MTKPVIGKSEIPRLVSQKGIEWHGDDLFSVEVTVYAEPYVDLKAFIERVNLMKPEVFCYTGCPIAPPKSGAKVTLWFFRVGKKLNDHQLAAEYRDRSLGRANPYSLATANDRFRNLRFQHRNRMHWRDAEENPKKDGKNSYASLAYSRDGVELVGLTQEYDGDWWYVGETLPEE